MIIFIDESGTLPDKTDRYIVLAAIATENPQGLEKILPKFRKKIPPKGSRKREKRVPEFKFHYVGDITRRKVLEEIILKDIRIYLLVIDKMGRRIKDTPENYGKLVKNLVFPLIKQGESKKIYLDKHFGNKSDTEELQSILDSISGKVDFQQVDSITDPRIDLADFVAGATLRKLRAHDEVFYDIISPKIVWERKKQWNQL